MAGLDIDTVLIVLAGVNVFLAVVMAGWGTQRVHPGFGLWMLGTVLTALASVILADRGHFSSRSLAVIVAALITVATTVRLEGMRRFFGRRRFDYRTLAVPALALALVACFAWAVDDVFARAVVVMAAVAALYWAMAAVVIPRAQGRDQHSYRIFAGLFVLYGVLMLVYGILWLVRGGPAPLEGLDAAKLVFFVLVMLFEICWVVIFLTMTTGRTAGTLERAHTDAEARRKQLDELLAFLPDATLAVDGRRNVIAWNRAAEELTGVPAAQVLGRPLDEGARAALGDRAPMLVDLALDPGRTDVPTGLREVEGEGGNLSALAELELPSGTGQKRHLWLAVAPLRDEGGVVTGAIQTIRDISSREEAQRVIRQREEQYRQLFKLNFDGILVIAPDGAIQDANPAACEMLGMTRDEICAAGHAAILFQDPETADLLEAPQPQGYAVRQLTCRRKNGTTFLAECMSVAYCDALGFPRAFMAFRDITERLEAQRVLRESEARLLQAQAVAHMGGWEIDLEARSVWMSPEALRIHGVPETSTYFAFDMAEVTRLAEDPGQLAAALESAIRDGGTCDVEYRIRRLGDGVPRVVHSKGQAVCDANGRTVRVTGMVQDITELRQVEDALGMAPQALDHAGDQIFWLGPDGRFIFVSDSACEQLGYTREELLAMSIYDIDPSLPKGPTEWPRARWQTVKQQGSIVHEGVHRTKDGRDIPVEVFVNYSEYNGQEYNFVFAREISERKRLEQLVSATQLSKGHESDQVFWLSPEGRITLANDAACRQLGYTRDQLLGMTIYDVDPLLSSDWRASWQRVKQRGSIKQEGVHRTKEGTDVPVEITSNYVKHDGKEYNLVFARDISDRKRAKDTINESQERARQALTMEAIGRLAGGIAHDFNNLLTAIMGYGNLILANEQVQNLSVRRDAEEIRTAAERASALTQKILAFSRRQTLQPRVLSVDGLIAGVEPHLEDVLGDGIEIATLLPPEPGYLEVDPDQMREVLVSLAANARDAMPDGGRLIVETRNVDISQEYCELYTDLQPGSYVLVSVSDTGVGMSPDILGHIFEPFFTTKEPGEGTGLGLSMAYGIIRQSGGFVNVYSEVGKGSTFKIYLPRVSQPAQPEPERVEFKTKQTVGGAETVLVVEDEAPLRRLVARILGGLGYRVFVAGSGPEALELLDDLEEPPDLLLSDVVLPGGMQGNDVAAAFLARIPDLPVLYVSGHARDAIVHSGRLDEGVNFLGKPFTPEALAAKVREVLDQPSETR